MLDGPFTASDGLSRSDVSNESDAVPVCDEDFDTVRVCDRDFETLRVAD
jgi:hypothetical protein